MNNYLHNLYLTIQSGAAVTSTPLRKKGPVSMKLTDETGDDVVQFSDPIPPAVEVKSGARGEPRTIDTAPNQGCVMF